MKSKKTTMKRLIRITLGIAIVSAFVFIACNKDKKNYRLDVHLTDAPAAYDEVNVDIESIKVKLREDSAGWVSFDDRVAFVRVAQFDLMDRLDGWDWGNAFPWAAFCRQAVSRHLPDCGHPGDCVARGRVRVLHRGVAHAWQERDFDRSH